MLEEVIKDGVYWIPITHTSGDPGQRPSSPEYIPQVKGWEQYEGCWIKSNLQVQKTHYQAKTHHSASLQTA